MRSTAYHARHEHGYKGGQAMSLFVAARQDAARDRRIGLSFWLAVDQERAIRKQYLTEVQQFAGRPL